MSDHKWKAVGNVEWCSWCGTVRATEGSNQVYSSIGGEVVTVTPEQADAQALEVSRYCHILPPHIMKSIVRWQVMAYRWGREPGHGLHFRVDAEHSSLLRRLLEGKTPFKEPPPLRHSYPWSDLIDNGREDNIDVREEQNKAFHHTEPMLYIDQHYWVILGKIGPEEWVVTYNIPNDEEIARQERKRHEDPTWRWYNTPPKQASTKWRVWQSGVRQPYNERHVMTPEQAKIWSIEKYEGEVPSDALVPGTDSK